MVAYSSYLGLVAYILNVAAAYPDVSSPAATPLTTPAPDASLCMTYANDMIKDCGASKKRYGGMVTSCPGKPEYPTISEPPCDPTSASTASEICITYANDMIKDCGASKKRYGGMVTSCPGKPEYPTISEPACDTTLVSKREACVTMEVDMIKNCGASMKRYGGIVTSCPGKPDYPPIKEPSCDTPKAAPATATSSN